MIEPPLSPAPNGMDPLYDDRGITQEGASDLRVDKPGSRWGMVFSYPPMQPDKSRVFTARFVRGKSEGVRIELPLLVPQGSPGAPVVDGAGQSGRLLNVRGFTPGYAVKEGYWLNIVEAATGYSYLHQAFGTTFADASGDAVLDLNPAMRAPFADGDVIELAKPWIEGRVQGEDWGWQVPVNRLIGLSVPVKENR
jgi:hypothetical protein